MDVSAMITELNDHGFDSASDARVIAFLNQAYWDICGRQPWPFLEKTVTLTFVGGSVTASNFPTDWRAAYTPMIVTAGANVGDRLPYIRYDDWLQRYGGTTDTSGVPRMWYQVGSTVSFWPAPASSITIGVGYLQQPAALADATLEAAIVIPVPYQNAIVDGALYRLYAMEDDTDIAPTFETYYERTIQNMSEYVWRKQYGQNDVVHPVDADDLGQDSPYFGPWSS